MSTSGIPRLPVAQEKSLDYLRRKAIATPPASLEAISKRAADLGLSYGAYVASEQYRIDKANYYPFCEKKKRK